jgi:hypothetical protein
MPEHENTKAIPRFESEEEEREFWASHDSTEYVEWSHAKPTEFSQLKPSVPIDQKLRGL